jgi:hypothetical protein
MTIFGSFWAKIAKKGDFGYIGQKGVQWLIGVTRGQVVTYSLT